MDDSFVDIDIDSSDQTDSAEVSPKQGSKDNQAIEDQLRMRTKNWSLDLLDNEEEDKSKKQEKVIENQIKILNNPEEKKEIIVDSFKI